MKLKEMRIKAGLSQQQLATLSGVNLRSLQDYEQGHKPLSCAKGETLYRLGTALGCGIEELLVEEGDEIARRERQALRIRMYEEALARKKESPVSFPVIVTDDIVDMSRIYPTKQRTVKAVLDALREDRRVESLRLFGSSITMRCHKDSDLDFAVGLKDYATPVKNEISERIQLCCDWGADILWMDRISDENRVYESVMKGLVLL